MLEQARAAEAVARQMKAKLSLSGESDDKLPGWLRDHESRFDNFLVGTQVVDRTLGSTPRKVDGTRGQRFSSTLPPPPHFMRGPLAAALLSSRLP